MKDRLKERPMPTAKIIHPFKTKTNWPATVQPQKRDETQHQLAELLIETSDSMIVSGSDFNVVSTNKNALTVHRASREELLGNDCRTLFSPAARTKLTTALSQLSENQKRIGELQAQRMDGQTFPADVTVKRIYRKNRLYFLLVIRDLSYNKRLHRLLRQERAQRREMYNTIGNLMKAFEKEKKRMARGIYQDIESLLLPALVNIKNEPDPTIRNGYLERLTSHLIGMSYRFGGGTDGRFLNLTRTEMRVCYLVQTGYASKEIAEKMHIAFETVQVHRRNIRRKLGLTGRNVNLHAFLADQRLFRVPAK